MTLIPTLKKRIFVDMDDTICKFSESYKEMRELYPNQKHPQSEEGFFLKLQPIEGAIESVKFLNVHEHYEVWFLSRPSVLNIHCYTEKAKWILKWFGQECVEKLILCTNKSLLIGDYLIDDHTGLGNSEFMGQFIHFGKGEFYDWKAVLKHLAEERSNISFPNE